MKRIAALMPAFNAARTICIAVESMLWQEVPANCRYEVVVLDDASTDETPAVLERIAAGPQGSRLRVLRNEVSLGAARSRNRLIEAADADYFFVMDADDVSLPGRLVAQVEALDSGHDLVGTYVYNFGQMHGERQFNLERLQHVVLAMIDQRSFCHPAVAYNRKVAQIGYRQRQACDYGLLTDVLLAGLDVTNIPRHYLMYRVHRDSLSNSLDSARIASLRQTVCAIRAGYIGRLLGIDAASAESYSDCLERKIFRRDAPEDLAALDRLGAIVRERLGVVVDFRRV